MVLYFCFNKGRIYVCNQMEEAANYIKQMHNKIQQLRSRREELIKKFDKSSCWGRSNVETSDDCSNCVAIHQILKNRLEILIRTKTSDDLELSRVLAELVEREMDIVSCLSTRTNAGFLHKIEIEVKLMDIDFCRKSCKCAISPLDQWLFGSIILFRIKTDHLDPILTEKLTSFSRFF